MGAPLLTVCVITYNHARYIAQCLDSVLGQEASFPWDVLVADDCSTDGTRGILERYRRAHPDRIRLLIQERNLGPAENFRRLLYAPASKYIAYLEGDDYWTDTHKLQKQVDVMERDPGVAGCFSNAIVVDADGKLVAADYLAHHKVNSKPEIRTADIVPFGISPANTLCLRSSVLHDPPAWFTETLRHSGLDLLITLHGGLRYLDDKMGAYRMHSAGAWSMTPVARRFMSDLVFLRALYVDPAMQRQFEPKIRESIRVQIAGLVDCVPEQLAPGEFARFFAGLAGRTPRSGRLTGHLFRFAARNVARRLARMTPRSPP